MTRVALSLLGVVFLLPSPALAQDQFAAAQAVVSGVLADVERNLIDKEAIEMNIKDWEASFNSFKPRLDELNGRYDAANQYCQGTYETEEYNRRKAYCEAQFSQLDTLREQLRPELEGLETRSKTLAQRDTDRMHAYDLIQPRLQSAIEQLVMACIALPPAEQRPRCHMPPAPGPRTREMVAAMESTLTGELQLAD